MPDEVLSLTDRTAAKYEVVDNIDQNDDGI